MKRVLPMLLALLTSCVDSTADHDDTDQTGRPPSGGGSTTTLNVPLTVQETEGVARTTEPVTSGVPLAKGAITDESQLRLLDGATVLPAQFQVTSRWPDNSIRWVLVDFQASVAANASKIYTLATGTQSVPSTSLSVSGFTVNTGAVEFTATNFIESFKVAGVERLAAPCTAPINGGSTTADQIVIEESGPMRVAIRVEGQGLLRWVMRIHAYAGKSYVKIVHAFLNTNTDGQPNSNNATQAAQLAAYVTMNDCSLAFPMNFAGSVSIGGSSGVHTGSSLKLYQTYTGAHDANDPNNPQPPGYDTGTEDGSSVPLPNCWPTQNGSFISYTVTDGSSGGHAPGWVSLTNGSLTATAAVRDFWQLYPKSLEGTGGGVLRVGLWPSDAWATPVFEGAMKSHEVAFDVRTGPGPAGALATWLHAPLFAACAPSCYDATRVFGPIGTTDVSSYAAAYQTGISNYLAQLAAKFNDIVGDRDSGYGGGHEYGMWNYGDGRTSDGTGAWENQHWSVTRACFVWFAASADLDYLRFGDTALRHFRDVDVLHSNVGRRYTYNEPNNPAISGGQTSQLGKTRYNPNNKQHDLGNYHQGSMNFECFKGEMLGDHYLLTGDRLSLDVLKEAFHFLRGTWKRFFDANYGGQDTTPSAATRWLSNALFVGVSYAECTGDPAGLSLVQYIVQRILARQALAAPYDPNGTGFTDSGGGFQAWMFGHLTEAMSWYRWVMDDASMDAHITDAMTWLLTDANVWLGGGALRETPTSGGGNYSCANLMNGVGFAEAYRITGNAQWRTDAYDVLTLNTANWSSFGDNSVSHKLFAQCARAVPGLLAAFKN